VKDILSVNLSFWNLEGTKSFKLQEKAGMTLRSGEKIILLAVSLTIRPKR